MYTVQFKCSEKRGRYSVYPSPVFVILHIKVFYNREGGGGPFNARFGCVYNAINVTVK